MWGRPENLIGTGDGSACEGHAILAECSHLCLVWSLCFSVHTIVNFAFLHELADSMEEGMEAARGSRAHILHHVLCNPRSDVLSALVLVLLTAWR